MPLISEQLPNLMNGVSQQAVTMRMTSQGEEQINGQSSLISGNVKRPPVKHVARIKDGSAAGSYIHTINRDANEQYTAILENRSIRVFDLEGNEKSVAYPNGTDYLDVTDPANSLRAVTVADYTFIVNRKKTVETASGLSQANANGLMFFIKETGYDVTYEIEIDGTVQATHTTPKSTDNDPKLSIEDVAEDLKDQLQTNVNGTGEFYIWHEGPIVYMKRNDSAFFKAKITDSEGNKFSDVIRDKVQRFTDLPVTARKFFVVKVTGDQDSSFDEYYLRFNPDNPDDLHGDGVWEEHLAPGIEYRLDFKTMPHVLVRMEDGSFEFRQETWKDRVAGDLDSAPWPSFVGDTINDVYFDRRRLCFLSGDNVVMSKAGDFFNFFPETVLQVLDDGRIDVSTTGTKAATLRYAAPFNQKILLFSDQVQYVIDSEFLLASSPPGVDTVSNYESSGFAAPVASGRTLFFAVNRGDWSGVLEYYVLEESDTTDAADVTEHVPRYIPSSVVRMAASPTADVVVALSNNDRGSLYVYKHHWQGNKKLQSSWSRWQLPEGASIQNVDFIKDTCLLIVDYPDGVYLESINVSEGQFDQGETFVYRFDRRCDESQVSSLGYDVGQNETTFILPYRPGDASLSGATRSRGGTSDKAEGQSLQILGGSDVPGGHLVRVQGDLTGTAFFIGILYEHRYTFSQAVLKTSSGTGGMATALAGRLQLKRWHVHIEDTGYFRVEVSPYGRDARVRETFQRSFTGTTLGSPNGIIGQLPLRSDRVSFRVNSRADKVKISLVNDSFLPSAFTAAEWEGRYSRNTSRV